jgi:flagellar export protein FliJ
VSKFKFPLKTVLDVKEIRKRQTVVDYSEVSRYLELQEQILCDMNDKATEISQMMMQETSKGITAADIKTHAAFLRRIDKDIRKQSKTVDEIKTEKRDLQALLLKLHNEVEVLDSLKQRQHLVHLYDLIKQEEKRIDEFSTYKMGRTHERLALTSRKEVL